VTSLPANHSGFLIALVGTIATFLIAATPVVAQAPPHRAPTNTQPAEANIEAAEATTPKPEQQRPSVWGEPTEVRVGIYVIDVDGVDSANQRFSASVYLQARWNIPLLRHEGPAPLIRRATSVWTPRLVLVNGQQAWSAFPPYVEISPDGEVAYRQKIWGWFSQPLGLRDFPFDKQRLTFHLVAAGLQEKEVKMVPLKRAGQSLSGIAEKFSMPDFNVTDWRAEARPYLPGGQPPGISGFILEMDIERLPNYYIWKVILPLCLIVMMSWIPRWLDPAEGGTSIGISTTAFLTLVAYLFAIVVLLPKVAYLTRLDRFILISTVLVFASLVQTVATTYLVKTGRNALANQINWFSRFIYPILLMLVLAASFT
jgi:hypothetical protein